MKRIDDFAAVFEELTALRDLVDEQQRNADSLRGRLIDLTPEQQKLLKQALAVATWLVTGGKVVFSAIVKLSGLVTAAGVVWVAIKGGFWK